MRAESVQVEASAAVVLRLLRQGAPAERFERLRCDVGDDPAARDVVEAALEIHRMLDERRMRESELTALYETAGDLSSLRDLEAVLQAIARRARQLLNTDVAYLTLIDEGRGDTYVRVTDGIRTEAFQATRLAMGAGLGGLVAQTGTPYTSADYLSDGRFVHTVDGVVGAEGLVAVAGVPLKIGSRVIGVLFAANRRRRPFEPRELAALISLADHAAIAIETASLFREVRSSVDELTKANEVVRTHSEAIERAAVVHERLTTLVVQGGRLPDLVCAVADVLAGTVMALDPQLHVLAVGGNDPRPYPGTRLVDGPTATACQAAASARRTIVVDDADGGDCATPVVAGADVLGVLVVTDRPDVGEADIRTLERAALVTALLLLTERSIVEAENRVRGDLLHELLAEPQPDADGLRRRARLLGADLDHLHAVVVARPTRPAERRHALDAAVRLARELGGLSGEHGRAVVALLPRTTPCVAAKVVAERLSRAVTGPVTIGAVGPHSGPADLLAGYHDALQCVEVLVALGREGEAAAASDLGAYALLFGRAGAAEMAGFVQHTLGPVLDYDAARGSDLAGTMEAYFAHDGNLARTASALYVHVNTLYQRLDRVRSLLGDGWRSGDRALQVHLALKLHRISPKV
jgi:sugar diacid utilization regulator